MGGHGNSLERRENDAVVSFVLRALQLAFSAMALVLVAGGFKSHTITVTTSSGESVALTTYLGGPTFNFVLLVTFSASLYTILWIAFVHLRRSVTLPLDVALCIDALFVVLLVSGALAFLASDYVRYCSQLHTHVRCGVVKTGGAFVLVAFLFFLCSVAWGAYLRLQNKQKKALRGNHASDMDLLPFEHDDVERTADAVDYMPSTSEAQP